MAKRRQRKGMGVNVLNIALIGAAAWLFFRDQVSGASQGLSFAGLKIRSVGPGPAGLRAETAITVSNASSVSIPLDMVYGDIFFSGTKVGSARLEAPVTIRGNTQTTVIVRTDISTTNVGKTVADFIKKFQENKPFGGELEFRGYAQYGQIKVPINQTIYSF